MTTNISMDEVKALRELTGVSVMQCKKALEEANGDKDKALIILRKKSGDVAAKKADRTLGAGTVASYVHNTGSVGAMVYLACETDFVAKNPEFKALAYDIAMHVAALNPAHNTIADVPEVELSKAKELFLSEVKDMQKPQEIKDKIVQGKLDTYFGERALMTQSFVKNPEVTIGELVSQAVQKFGEKTEIVRFVRLSATE